MKTDGGSSIPVDFGKFSRVTRECRRRQQRREKLYTKWATEENPKSSRDYRSQASLIER